VELTVQIAGNVNSTVAEVELNTLAGRRAVRPNDVLGSNPVIQPVGGSFSTTAIATITGNGTTFTAPTNAPILAMQWVDPNNLFVLKKLSIKQAAPPTTTSYATAGVWTFQVFRAQAFVRQYDTYGVDNVTNVWLQAAQTMPVGVGGKRKSTMLNARAGGYQPGDIANVTLPTGGGGTPLSINSSTVSGGSVVFLFTRTLQANVTAFPPLGGGQNTLDPFPFAAITTSVPTATLPYNNIGLNSPIYDSTDTYPMIFDCMTGFVVQTTFNGSFGVAATISFIFSMDWEELPNF
jgi:hypothetical protein